MAKNEALMKKQMKQLIKNKAEFLINQHFVYLRPDMTESDLYAYFSQKTSHHAVADKAAKIAMAELIETYGHHVTEEPEEQAEEEMVDELQEDFDEEVFYEEDAH